MKEAQGFTLLEILVVCVLIGLVGTLSVANLGFGEKGLAREEASRLMRAMDWLRQESTLTGQVLGVRFSHGDNGSAQSRYDYVIHDEEWRPLEDAPVPKSIPDGVKLKWEQMEAGNGVVVIEPNGIMAPFAIEFIAGQTR